MKELLEKIAISNTDERLEKIIDILDEWDFDFKLQSTEYTFPIFDWLMLNKKFHYFDDDEINEVINDEENEIFESDFHKEYTRNLIISFNSQIIKDRIILSAHYDIVNGSMGANDNGSSIVILLKLAKYLKEKNTKLPIDIVFFDKEECGSKGCSDFIDEYKEKYKKESIDPNFTQSLDNSLKDALSIKNQIKMLSDKIEHNYNIYLDNKKLLNNNLILQKNIQNSEFTNIESVKKDKQKIQENILKQQNKKNKIEYRIGGELFGLLGAILILISIITLGKTLLPTFLQGIALFLIPVITLLLGELCERKLSPKFSKILTAIGISSAYIAILINYLYMKNINSLMALILVIVITTGSLYISNKKKIF